MIIDEIRIYSEVLEQGLDIKEYLATLNQLVEIKNIYTKKNNGFPLPEDSIIERLRKTKDFDILVTAITGHHEYPLFVIEYSASVPTDDHKMQRSDVYFWGAIFKLPVIKIYADTKGMDQSFGGGDRITAQIEQSLAYSKQGMLYLIPWKVEKNRDILEVNDRRFSCIKQNEKLSNIINNLISTFKTASKYSDYYQFCLDGFVRETLIKKIQPKDIIVNSTRFNWNDDDLTVKINRFGHAMDPDRGVLFFTNMLVGVNRLITEIQVQRSSLSGRGGYKALFDGVSKQIYLSEFTEEIFNYKKNIVDSESAVHIFLTALNLVENLKITKVTPTEYKIEDQHLKSFFEKSRSMTANSIFLLSHKLILTDVNRNVIASISWNSNISDEFLNKFHAPNYSITRIRPLLFADAKEDIVTYSSVELFKKISAEIVSVSYPGAQGDRAILVGEGRNIERTYIDIIAMQKMNDNIFVFIQENKEKMSSLRSDVQKLNEIKYDEENFEGLMKLLNKTKDINYIDKLSLGVGSKQSDVSNFIKANFSEIDYIFMFNFQNTPNNTVVNWHVAIVDTNLTEQFKNLINTEGKLKGNINLNKVFVIA